MNADELADLLDGLPDAAQWTPPSPRPRQPADPNPGEKPSLWSQPIFNVDPKSAGMNGASARAASVAIVTSLASVPGRVPALAEAEWAQAREAASKFRAEHEGASNRGSARFIDLSTGMRVRCHCW